MKEIFRDLFGFIYSLRLGDYFFFIGTFLLIVLFIYVIYLIKVSEEEGKGKDKDKVSEVSNDLLELTEITKAIESDYKPGTIELTGYEEEQENNAIISYEELIKKKDTMGINYDDEYIFEDKDLAVKKISLKADGEKPDSKLEVKLMRYDKEEAFLKALRQLQKDLTN